MVVLLAVSPGLARAAVSGAWRILPPPPQMWAPDADGRVEHEGARIWYASFGGVGSNGPPVILLAPGDASSDIWGNQVPALVADHHRVIVIDSRGAGRSHWDGRIGYQLMAGDVIAVMDAAGIDHADVVGWSDGAIVALIMAMQDRGRVRRVFAFGANMDVGGLNPLGIFAPVLPYVDALMKAEYARDTGGAAGFAALTSATRHMQMTSPHFAAADLAAIHGPTIAICDGDRDEIISHRHTDYLARTIPGAALVWLPQAGHFAPLQAPDAFDAAVLTFLDK